MSGATAHEPRDEYWMQQALQQARLAQQQQEVPVGAIVVVDDQLVSSGFNRSICSHDPTAHAEIVALRSACEQLHNHRLPGATLYVTLEPCMMCAGALVQARVKRLVYGATEPKAGAVSSHALLSSGWLNHQVSVSAGVLAEPCGQLLSDFFAARRAQASQA